MLSLILDWQKCEFDFKGEKITAELRPLKRRAMLELMPFMGGKSAASVENALELQGTASKVFPEHVRNVEGIQINGETPTPEQFAEESYLFELTTSIITRLANISSLKDEDQKNSGGASGNVTLEVNNLESSADAPSI